MARDAELGQLRQVLEEKVNPLVYAIDAATYGLKGKDAFAQGHSQAVSWLAAQIAMQMRLSEAEIGEIRLASIVHDIGMSHVPDYVLNKPTQFTAEDFEIMEIHAAWGAKILEPVNVTGIERIVCHHHERYDGQGYPDKLKGEEIPLGARIIAVANAFHAMVSAHVYRKARTVEETLAELRRCSGTQFDPKVVTAFLDWIEAHDDPREQQ